jgi:hypothetical protein
MQPISVYNTRRVMKFRAIVALLLVLVTGFVRDCPACDQAALREKASFAELAAPPAGHACCHKDPAPPSQPASSPEDSPDGDCGREHVSAILRAANLESASASCSLNIELAALSVAPLPAEPLAEIARSASLCLRTNSPPVPIRALPIRI